MGREFRSARIQEARDAVTSTSRRRADSLAGDHRGQRARARHGQGIQHRQRASRNSTFPGVALVCNDLLAAVENVYILCRT